VSGQTALGKHIETLSSAVVDGVVQYNALFVTER
jgi:hypothetical protein